MVMISENIQAHIRRRITNRMNISGIKDIAQMQSMVLNDDDYFSELLQDLSITVTEMFRSCFLQVFARKVIPILKHTHS
jgi:chemotaxis protein methyltransferase CheR